MIYDAYKSAKIVELSTGEKVNDIEAGFLKYINTEEGPISRAIVVGTVLETRVNNESNSGSVTVDDTTGIIRVQTFGEDIAKIEGLKQGDIVKIFGRVREYESNVYLLLQILRKISKDELQEQKNYVDFLKEHWLKMSEQIGTDFVVFEGSSEDFAKFIAKKYRLSLNEAEVMIKEIKTNKSQQSEVAKKEKNDADEQILIQTLPKYYREGGGATVDDLASATG
ncbi:MAG: hypothetical protein CVU81_00495, partial [Euryarchaeota archaeon HGW-Euryarchaeota-1]